MREIIERIQFSFPRRERGPNEDEVGFLEKANLTDDLGDATHIHRFIFDGRIRKNPTGLRIDIYELNL